MHYRALVVLCAVALLAACGSDRPKPEQAQRPHRPRWPRSPAARPAAGLPARVERHAHGDPAGADVELALLVIDDRGRPQQLLASSSLTGTGQALPYQLRFNPEAFPAGARVELRGRASQSGQLIMHLPPVRITQAETQATGPLRFERPRKWHRSPCNRP
jgi:uncharacterized lipoprotein YbaY